MRSQGATVERASTERVDSPARWLTRRTRNRGPTVIRLASEVADAADEKPRSHSRAGLYRASGLAGEVVAEESQAKAPAIQVDSLT
jgi:hypothetical protein